MRNYCEPYDKNNADKMLGVPIVKVFDMEGTPERSNLKETADFVVENLKQAISLNQTDQHIVFTWMFLKLIWPELIFGCKSGNWQRARPRRSWINTR